MVTSVNVSGLINETQVNNQIDEVAVRHDVTQTITDAGKARARTNIGLGTSATLDTVDAVTNGEMKPITSNAVFDGLALKIDTYTAQTQNTFLAAPTGLSGVPTFRAMVAADVPTLNQSTTGSAATLTTTRSIAMSGDVTWTVNFNGSANVTAVGTIENNAVTTSKISDANVTLEKMANMATASLLGRNTAGTGTPEVLSVSTARTLLGLGSAALLDTIDSASDGEVKPITSNAVFDGLAFKAPLASPTFTGTVLTPKLGTTGAGDSTTPNLYLDGQTSVGFAATNTNSGRGFICAGGAARAYFDQSAFTFTPDGSNTRVGWSDTSMQLHYDCIIKAGDNSTKLPNLTFKALDDGTNSGSDIPLLSITCALSAGAQFAADHKESLKFYTDDNTGTVHTAASILRAELTAGVAASTLYLRNGTDLYLESGGSIDLYGGGSIEINSGNLTFAGSAIVSLSGGGTPKIAMGGYSISMSPSTGAQMLHTYLATSTAYAGIGTDSSYGGLVTRMASGGAATDSAFFGNGYVVIGTGKAGNGQGILQVAGNCVPYTDAARDLGTSSHKWNNIRGYTIDATTAFSIGGTEVIDSDRLFVLRAYTVATLPAASGKTGKAARVTDGASSKNLVVSDGSVWKYADGVSV
jgi:hypothetical protein